MKGFPQAIAAVFPITEIQTYIVHQIRSSLRYIAEKHKKAFMADLKPVYQALNQEEGYKKLLQLDEKWAGNIRFRCKADIITGSICQPSLGMMLLFARSFIKPIW